MAGIATAFDCPNCGAVLSAGARAATEGLWPCLYCGALLRVSGDGGADRPAPSVERTLDAEVMARVRAHVLEGRLDEATRVCEVDAGMSRALAVSAVGDLAQSVSARAIMSQPLSALGWLFVVVALGCLGGGVFLSASTWLGWLLAAFGLLNLLALARAISTTIRFASAPRGVAVVRHVADVGTRPAAGGVRVFSLAVDVEPAGGAPFHARLVVPVRAKSVRKIAVGARIPVRYRADDPSWLRYDAGADPDRG